MKIALISSVGLTLDSFFPEIVSEWVARGSTVLTGASTASGVGDFTRLRRLTRRPAPSNLLAPTELRRWLRKTGADILVTNTATASALARVRRMPVPVVYFCHGLHWNEGEAAGELLWQAIEASLVGRADGVVTINSDDEAWFTARVPGARLLRLPWGVGVPLARFPAARFPPTAGSSYHLTSLLWAGEFSERKRPHQAVEVLMHLRHAGVDARLVMLGDGPLYDSVQRQVADEGLTDAVSLLGRGDVARHLSQSDALLHTAKWEGLPRVMLEALAMGRRTYAYDVKGVRDIPGAVLGVDSSPGRLADLIRRDVRSGRIHEVEEGLAGLDTRSVATEIHGFLTSIVSQGRR
ncbi:glycosyltransferase [Glaciibacter sp. 2TAF33]|uniref:glycosyltransferase n=1 Tax=Glaciibacter sp. 2TAF33 TaxID=3233015 RepID=UPI003F93964D